MALPASLGTVTLHATCLHYVTGEPLTGTILLVPQGLQVASPGGATALLPGNYSAPVVVGEMSVVVPVTDDPDWAPATSYQVTERLEGVTNRDTYYITIPNGSAGSTVELYSLAALPAPTAATLEFDGGPW